MFYADSKNLSFVQKISKITYKKINFSLFCYIQLTILYILRELNQFVIYYFNCTNT